MGASKIYRILYAPIARDDLDSILEYVARVLHAPESALSLIERVEAGILSLSEFPTRTPPIKDESLAKRGYRTLFVDNFVVIFVVDEQSETVVIHRIVYGRRKYTWMLK